MDREIDTAKKNLESTNDLGKEYYDWISELSQRYRQSQIKAAVKVNSEMLRFYWSVGKDIEERKLDNKYFYCLYSPLLANRQQLVDDLETPTRPQLVDDLEILFRIPWGHHRYIIDKVSAQRVGSAVHSEELQDKLPTEQEIENGLKMITKKKWWQTLFQLHLP